MRTTRLAVGCFLTALTLSMSSMPVSAKSITVTDPRDDVQRERYNSKTQEFVLIPGFVTPTPKVDIVSVRYDYSRNGELAVVVRAADIAEASLGLSATAIDVDGDEKSDVVLALNAFGEAFVVERSPSGQETLLCNGKGSVNFDKNRLTMRAPSDCIGSPASITVSTFVSTKRFKGPGILRKRWFHDFTEWTKVSGN